MRCPECQKWMVRNGWRNGVQRWVCPHCRDSLTEGGRPPHRPMAVSGVYQIKCLKSGAAYIGSSTSIKRRFQAHKSNMRRCHREGAKWLPYLSNSGLYSEAIAFDPDEDFVFEVLEEVPKDGALLAEREKYWVEKLQPTLNRVRVSRPDQCPVKEEKPKPKMVPDVGMLCPDCDLLMFRNGMLRNRQKWRCRCGCRVWQT